MSGSISLIINTHCQVPNLKWCFSQTFYNRPTWYVALTRVGGIDVVKPNKGVKQNLKEEYISLN